ncbi:MAG: glycosyltransferase [[Eubacterium] siraeum]
MPLISVIMGVHNSETDMLLSAVGSVLSQSVSDIELIICDDGSENGIGENA